ncbi:MULTISPECIES: MucR family transcriptional regulator [Sphingobium]|uniref:MucR family transcriptional regulator n=1 Tax=Sphingobium sp. MI1205 TaxID=407020 RepID=UPI0007704462|nr:MucR family transcriptional regulator [Sphingobium sp. MI1205]AMK20282.1 MucR-family transcriptional regulator [Sphingobium sp. MI1205]
MADEDKNDITALTVQLLSAYVSRNSVPSDSLADLIRTTRAALTENAAAAVAEPAAETFTPAVSVRRSLASPDRILSLIDGRPYKTLKRHLAAHGLTPEQYRERYKLPSSYPLVAQSYSEARRAVAEKAGLGKKPVAAASPTAAPQAKVAAPKAPEKAAAPKKDKAKDAPAPIISNRGNRAATSASAKKAPAQEKAPVKKAAPKANGTARPKSPKAALQAAGSHLGGGEKAPEAATAKS